MDPGLSTVASSCAWAVAAMSLRSRLNCYSCGTTGPKDINGRNCRLTRCIGAECFAELTQPYVVVDGESRPPPCLERFDKERCSKPGCGRCASPRPARCALFGTFCALHVQTRAASCHCAQGTNCLSLLRLDLVPGLATDKLELAAPGPTTSRAWDARLRWRICRACCTTSATRPRAGRFPRGGPRSVRACSTCCASTAWPRPAPARSSWPRWRAVRGPQQPFSVLGLTEPPCCRHNCRTCCKLLCDCSACLLGSMRLSFYCGVGGQLYLQLLPPYNVGVVCPRLCHKVASLTNAVAASGAWPVTTPQYEPFTNFCCCWGKRRDTHKCRQKSNCWEHFTTFVGSPAVHGS